MSLQETTCPDCGSHQLDKGQKYAIKSGEDRQLYHCSSCQLCFSETKNTAIFGLKTPLSRIVMILGILLDGMAINAVARRFGVGKKSIYRWQERLSDMKETLLLYSLCHEFIKQEIEGDEVYTKVNKNLPPDESQGWTIILMERASRFIWQMECNRKTRKLFKRAMPTLC